MKTISRFLILLVAIFIYSCDKEYHNPYDRECQPEIWTPINLIATLSENGIEITWEQNEIHFDGFVLERSDDSVSWSPVNIELIDKTARNYTDVLNTSLQQVYYRIFAKADKNASDTSYSKVLKMPDTPIAGLITDSDGNTYVTVKIGEQVWMRENLKTTKYRDGTAIKFITDNAEWVNELIAHSYYGAYCWYSNDISKGSTYGAIYNYYATVDNHQLCPVGWHVPTIEEFTELKNYLGGESISGAKLKEVGTSHWLSPNSGATNVSGFTSLPAGYRAGFSGEFYNLRRTGILWSSSEYNFEAALDNCLYYDDSNIYTSRTGDSKNSGFSVRCIQGEGKVLPGINTVNITDLRSTSAKSGGNITSDGGSPVTAKGVCWSTSLYPTLSDAYTIDGTGTGIFISSMTGLEPSTTYHVRAYATNSVGTAYGNDVTFSTSLPSNSATIITRIVHGVTSMSAICGGEIFSDGGMEIIERGVCWSRSPNPTINNNKTSDGSGIGKYDSYVKGLEPTTTYYIRAFAMNSGGTVYGDEMTFITYAHYVTGDIYQGGIVFYITGTYPNQHGLVVAEVSQSNGIPWWNGSNLVTGATGTEVGTGQANTNAIISAQGPGRYAATICDELVLNGYSDWFLPSIGECGLIYNNLFINGLFPGFNMMWSSSEYNQNNAWTQYHQSMQYPNYAKIYEWEVYAVRAF